MWHTKWDLSLEHTCATHEAGSPYPYWASDNVYDHPWILRCFLSGVLCVVCLFVVFLSVVSLLSTDEFECHFNIVSDFSYSFLAVDTKNMF